MSDLTLRHEMNCDADTYWEKCVLDEGYNQRLFLEGLRFKSYELVEQKDLGDTVTRRAKADPQPPNVPAAVKKVIGESFGYVEDGTYDRKTKIYTFKTTPNAFGDKVKISGTMQCESIGEKKVARITKIHLEVKVFMVGGMIEDRIVADMKDSYAKAADFTNLWVKEKGL
jgi:hypothetical protein